MKSFAKKIAANIAADILFGLIAAVFCYFIMGEIVPAILNGLHAELGNEAIKISFIQVEIDPIIFKRIFSIWHNFCLLFGIRVVIAYITGVYSFKDFKFAKKSGNEKKGLLRTIIEKNEQNSETITEEI